MTSVYYSNIVLHIIQIYVSALEQLKNCADCLKANEAVRSLNVDLSVVSDNLNQTFKEGKEYVKIWLKSAFSGGLIDSLSSQAKLRYSFELPVNELSLLQLN